MTVSNTTSKATGRKLPKFLILMLIAILSIIIMILGRQFFWYIQQTTRSIQQLIERTTQQQQQLQQLTEKLRQLGDRVDQQLSSVNLLAQLRLIRLLFAGTGSITSTIKLLQLLQLDPTTLLIADLNQRINQLIQQLIFLQPNDLEQLTNQLQQLIAQSQQLLHTNPTLMELQVIQPRQPNTIPALAAPRPTDTTNNLFSNCNHPWCRQHWLAATWQLLAKSYQWLQSTSQHLVHLVEQQLVIRPLVADNRSIASHLTNSAWLLTVILQQASLAVMTKQSANYTTSLNTAKQLIMTHLKPLLTVTDYQAMLHQLDALLTIKWQPTQTQILGLLTNLIDYTQQQLLYADNKPRELSSTAQQHSLPSLATTQTAVEPAAAAPIIATSSATTNIDLQQLKQNRSNIVSTAPIYSI